MKRRRFLACAIAASVVPSRLTAQQRGRIYRVGILGISEPRPEILKLSVEPFRQRLRELGWIEGKNLVIEQRWAKGRAERFTELAAELVRLKVDVIVTPTSQSALAARKATETVPIVGTFLADPVKYGVARSYARPGGNVTGLASEPGGLPIAAKTLEFLKEALPAASRIAVLINPGSDFAPRLLMDVETAARTLNVTLLPVEAGSPEEFARAFVRMRENRADAVYVLADAMFFTNRARIAELAIEHRLPSASATAQFAQAGGLINYVMDLADNYRRAADYVDKIFKGANPADLPIEQPIKFRLLVNTRTAKVLGIKLPRALVLRAEQVIE